MEKNCIYASPLKRFASFAIDLVIIMVIFNLILYVANYYGLELNIYKQEIVVENKGTADEKVSVVDRIDKKILKKVNFILLTVSATYFTFFLASKKQATIGHQIFKVMVVDVEKGRVSILSAFIRYVAFLLNNTLYGIGYLTYFFRDDHAVMQDILSNTAVINVKQ